VIITTPTDREILVTKEFAAPRRLVFEAHTRPELLKRWFGPHAWRLEVCEIDLRPGGCWYYLMRGPGGTTMTLRGTYLEIVEPERIVATESNVDCEARAAHESVGTLVFTEHAGRTTLTNTIRWPSKEIRDSVLSSGMRRGLGEGLDRLTELLAATTRAAPR
jgi:uncharacterized protein YndB with AHSA1/START domain